MAVAVPPPPAEPVAKERSWIGSAVAIVGIVGGFLCLIVPGIFAYRSWRRWERGEIASPVFAWVMAGVSVFLVASTIGAYWLVYGRPLVEDDFSDSSSGWVTIEDPYTLGYADGAYDLAIDPSPQAGLVALAGYVWEEGSLPNVRTEASVVSLDAAAGVGCGNSEEEAGYLFLVTGDGSYLVTRSTDLYDWEVLSSGDLPEGVDATGARVHGECRAGAGPHELRMSVDGTEVVVVPIERGVETFDTVLLAAGSPGDDPASARMDDVFAIAVQPS